MATCSSLAWEGVAGGEVSRVVGDCGALIGAVGGRGVDKWGGGVFDTMRTEASKKSGDVPGYEKVKVRLERLW
jgi:hypothetical protein